MKNLVITLAFFGLIMTLLCKPAISYTPGCCTLLIKDLPPDDKCSETECGPWPDAEGRANSMVVFFTSVPALILSILMGRLMY